MFGYLRDLHHVFLVLLSRYMLWWSSSCSMCIFCLTAILNKVCQKVPNIKVMSHGHLPIASANADSSFSIGRYIHACMGSCLRRKQPSFTFCQSIKIRLINSNYTYDVCPFFPESGAGSKGNLRYIHGKKPCCRSKSNRWSDQSGFHSLESIP